MATLQQSPWHIVGTQKILVALPTWGQRAYSGQALKDEEKLGERGQEINA